MVFIPPKKPRPLAANVDDAADVQHQQHDTHTHTLTDKTERETALDPAASTSATTPEVHLASNDQHDQWARSRLHPLPGGSAAATRPERTPGPATSAVPPPPAIPTGSASPRLAASVATAPQGGHPNDGDVLTAGDVLHDARKLLLTFSPEELSPDQIFRYYRHQAYAQNVPFAMIHTANDLVMHADRIKNALLRGGIVCINWANLAGVRETLNAWFDDAAKIGDIHIHHATRLIGFLPQSLLDDSATPLVSRARHCAVHPRNVETAAAPVLEHITDGKLPTPFAQGQRETVHCWQRMPELSVLQAHWDQAKARGCPLVLVDPPNDPYLEQWAHEQMWRHATGGRDNLPQIFLLSENPWRPIERREVAQHHAPPLVVNAVTFDELYAGVTIDPDSGEARATPGLMAQRLPGQPILITSDLPNDDHGDAGDIRSNPLGTMAWKRLMCDPSQAPAPIWVTPNVHVPQRYVDMGLVTVMPLAEPTLLDAATLPVRAQLPPSMVVVSADPAYCAARLQQNMGSESCTLLPVTATHDVSDLLGTIQEDPRKGPDHYAYVPQQCWQLLCSGKTVVLQADHNPNLLNALGSMLADPPYAVINGRKQEIPPPGRLIVITTAQNQSAVLTTAAHRFFDNTFHRETAQTRYERLWHHVAPRYAACSAEHQSEIRGQLLSMLALIEGAHTSGPGANTHEAFRVTLPIVERLLTQWKPENRHQSPAQQTTALITAVGGDFAFHSERYHYVHNVQRMRTWCSDGLVQPLQCDLAQLKRVCSSIRNPSELMAHAWEIASCFSVHALAMVFGTRLPIHALPHSTDLTPDMIANLCTAAARITETADPFSQWLQHVANQLGSQEYNPLLDAKTPLQNRPQPKETFTALLTDCVRALRRGEKVLYLMGPPGAGKSFMLKALSDHYAGASTPAMLQLSFQRHDHADVQRIVETWKRNGGILALDEGDLVHLEGWVDLAHIPDHCRVVITGNGPTCAGRIPVPPQALPVYFPGYDADEISRDFIMPLFDISAQSTPELQAFARQICDAHGVATALAGTDTAISPRNVQELAVRFVQDPTLRTASPPQRAQWLRTELARVYGASLPEGPRGAFTSYLDVTFGALTIPTLSPRIDTALRHKQIHINGRIPAPLAAAPSQSAQTPRTRYEGSVCEQAAELDRYLTLLDAKAEAAAMLSSDAATAAEKRIAAQRQGMRGVMVFGESGVGKDVVVDACLEAHGYTAIDAGTLTTLPVTSDGHRHYIKIASTNVDVVKDILAQAARKGVMVVWPEANLWKTSDVEMLLNTVLAGESHSRFGVIVTANPSNARFGARAEWSPALRNRFIAIHRRNYHDDELQDVLHERFPTLSQGQIAEITRIHCDMNARLAAAGLHTRVTPRQARDAAEEILRCGPSASPDMVCREVYSYYALLAEHHRASDEAHSVKSDTIPQVHPGTGVVRALWPTAPSNTVVRAVPHGRSTVMVPSHDVARFTVAAELPAPLQIARLALNAVIARCNVEHASETPLVQVAAHHILTHAMPTLAAQAADQLPTTALGSIFTGSMTPDGALDLLKCYSSGKKLFLDACTEAGKDIAAARHTIVPLFTDMVARQPCPLPLPLVNALRLALQHIDDEASPLHRLVQSSVLSGPSGWESSACGMRILQCVAALDKAATDLQTQSLTTAGPHGAAAFAADSADSSAPTAPRTGISAQFQWGVSNVQPAYRDAAVAPPPSPLHGPPGTLAAGQYAPIHVIPPDPLELPAIAPPMGSRTQRQPTYQMVTCCALGDSTRFHAPASMTAHVDTTGRMTLVDTVTINAPRMRRLPAPLMSVVEIELYVPDNTLPTDFTVWCAQQQPFSIVQLTRSAKGQWVMLLSGIDDGVVPEVGYQVMKGIEPIWDPPPPVQLPCMHRVAQRDPALHRELTQRTRPIAEATSVDARRTAIAQFEAWFQLRFCYTASSEARAIYTDAAQYPTTAERYFAAGGGICWHAAEAFATVLWELCGIPACIVHGRREVGNAIGGGADHAWVHTSYGAFDPTSTRRSDDPRTRTLVTMSLVAADDATLLPPLQPSQPATWADLLTVQAPPAGPAVAPPPITSERRNAVLRSSTMFRQTMGVSTAMAEQGGRVEVANGKLVRRAQAGLPRTEPREIVAPMEAELLQSPRLEELAVFFEQGGVLHVLTQKHVYPCRTLAELASLASQNIDWLIFDNADQFLKRLQERKCVPASASWLDPETVRQRVVAQKTQITLNRMLTELTATNFAEEFPRIEAFLAEQGDHIQYFLGTMESSHPAMIECILAHCPNLEKFHCMLNIENPAFEQCLRGLRRLEHVKSLSVMLYCRKRSGYPFGQFQAELDQCMEHVRQAVPNMKNLNACKLSIPGGYRDVNSTVFQLRFAPTLTALTLHGFYFDASNADTIASLVDHCRALTSLEISYCSLPSEGIDALGVAVSAHAHLQTMTARRVEFPPGQLETFLSALSNCATLTNLDFSGCNLSHEHQRMIDAIMHQPNADQEASEGDMAFPGPPRGTFV